MSKGYPDRIEAEAIIAEAEPHNPGPWVEHSRVAAYCAERIAAACPGMDADKAYTLGLLHDIGRRFGVGHLSHVYDGWRYMTELGYADAARICLTHSFNTHTLDGYIGNIDISPEKTDELRRALAECEFDEYDMLIQLCDAMAMAEGVVDVETRMGDVKRRYGRYPEDKWQKNIETKEYFERRSGRSIYELTAGKLIK